MLSSGLSRRRHTQRIAVEILEGRDLLSTLATASTFEIEPTGVQGVSHNATAQSQGKNANANAGDALRLGKQYAQTVLSKTTGTVIANYTKALLSGNGKELKSLGNSSSVQQLEASFTNAGNSSQAQAISHSFKSLGHSISQEFDKIFD
jgi:hypothetical protein